MRDRASTFKNPELVKLLQKDFIPVAIDQWYQRRQKDNEGEFYRKIAGQGPRKDFEETTQGRYVCTADGQLLGYNNNFGAEKILPIMKEALAKFDSKNAAASIVQPGKRDPEFNPTLKKNGMILRVNARVLGGYEKGYESDWRTTGFKDSTSRDNMWIQPDEKQALIKSIQAGDDIPKNIAQRIARFHLLDNTRGEPPRWTADEIKSLSLSSTESGELKGQVHLETKDGKRGYIAKLLGRTVVKDNELKSFDLVAKGRFWGKGPYTRHEPKGKFPLAIAFRIADGTDPADKVVPYGLKGWTEPYINLK